MKYITTILQNFFILIFLQITLSDLAKITVECTDVIQILRELLNQPVLAKLGTKMAVRRCHPWQCDIRVLSLGVEREGENTPPTDDCSAHAYLPHCGDAS